MRWALQNVTLSRDAELREILRLAGGPAMTGEEAFEAVLGRGAPLPLANGWRLARRRIAGADRIEIEGPADTDITTLKRLGCTVEIVGGMLFLTLIQRLRLISSRAFPSGV